jgi:hypothetical protein
MQISEARESEGLPLI